MSKPVKTTRILFERIIIYCSYQMGREVKDLCVRLEQNKLCPMRGKNQEVLDKLRELAKDNPDHFTANGLTYLGVH